ncbi:MAG: conserved rane protein of unknown function [Blastococcus sp.]|jgi:hypothetical protein|nr:conserved rane protein of unknown function [Blastococcus sp.]
MSRWRPWRTAVWAVLGVLAAGWLALVEVFWLPLRVAGVLVPLSVLAGVVGNLLIVGAVRRLTGSGALAVLPAVAWLVVVVPAMIRRPEGDLIIAGGGDTGVVNLGFLLLGVVAAAYAVGRALSGPRRPPVSRSGSGTGGAR